MAVGYRAEDAQGCLHFVFEISDEKISYSLGVSEANVRVIRHRAIHQLRGCMGVAA